MKIQHLLVLAAITLQLTACDQQKHQTIAIVDGNNISQESFDAYLTLKHINKTDITKVKQHLDLYLSREAIATAIEKSDIKTKQRILAEINEAKKQILISRYFDHYLNNRVTEEAISNYYASHADYYSAKKARVAHILIRIPKNSNEQDQQAKYTLALEAHGLLQTGENFNTVVEKYSEDAVSKKKQGELGWISEGTVDQKFSDTVFKQLKSGEISTPILTSFGYHIVKLLEGPAVVKKPLENVKGDIRQQLRQEAKQAEKEKLKASVTIVKLRNES